MQRFVTFVNQQFKLSEMKVLVTGANGLLGHHIVFELLKRNLQVAIIVRSTENIFFDLKAVEVIVGDFMDYDSLKYAATACNAIIHTAATTSTKLLYYQEYQNINSHGAALVVQVANVLNIHHLVFVSTANTIGYGNSNAVADETFPIESPFSNSFYAQSKVEAEEIFVKASKMPKNHVVIINPTFMIGAFDTKPSSGRLLLMAYKKRLMFIPKGGKNFVDVSAVGALVCNALNRGRNGERYLASGKNMSFREFYTLQKQIGNYKQLLIEIPDTILKLIARVGDLLRKMGIKTEINSMNVKQLIIREYYSNQKAKSELEMPDTDMKISISNAIDWFKLYKKI